MREVVRCAFAVATGSAVALALSPVAYADPLDGVRQAVVNARNGTRCPALNYSIPLEGNAQNDSGNLLPGVPPVGQYHGVTARFSNSSDPAARAISGLVSIPSFQTAINDCGFKDFGVGFYRTGGLDYVSVELGKPPAPPPPPAAPPPPAPSPPALPVHPSPPLVPAPPAPAAQLPHISGDVDLYAQPGGVGKPEGMVPKGTPVNVVERRGDNWVHVTCAVAGRHVDGWVWGDFVPKT